MRQFSHRALLPGSPPSRGASRSEGTRRRIALSAAPGRSERGTGSRGTKRRTGDACPIGAPGPEGGRMEPEGCSVTNHRRARNSCPARGTVKKRTSRDGNPRGRGLRRDAMAQSPAMNSPKRLTGGLVALVAALVVAACGSSTPTTAPATTGPQPTAPASVAPTDRPRRPPLLPRRRRPRPSPPSATTPSTAARGHGGRQRPRLPPPTRRSRARSQDAARPHGHDTGRARRVRHRRACAPTCATSFRKDTPEELVHGDRDALQGARADAPGRLARAARTSTC